MKTFIKKFNMKQKENKMKYALIIIITIISLIHVNNINAEVNQSSIDLELSEHIENETKTFSFTTGSSIPWDATNCGMTIQYKAHSQSGSNFRQNSVHIEILKNNELLTQHIDNYNSETSWGTPIPGFIHNTKFQDINISQGDRIELKITVSHGDYKNYVSHIQLETCWQIPDILMPSYDTLAAFQLNYSIWNNPQNGFIEELTAPPYSHDEPGRRVIFMHDPAPSSDGQHVFSTVSEGMGYALLISYAANDQSSFNAFLRYILNISEQGCSSLAGSQTEDCNIKSKLMPWIVDQDGKPFWYCSSEDQCNYSSGSASDADIQIAYSLYLASKKWPTGNVYGLSYSDHFNKMLLELNRYVFFQASNNNEWLFSPGNSWGTSGLWVLYPGYLTPHALEAFSLSYNNDNNTQNNQIPEKGQIIIQNNSPASCHFDYFSSSDNNINLINAPVSDSNLNYYDQVKFDYQILNPYWSEFRIQCTQWSIKENQFFQNLLGLETNEIPGCNYAFHWENNQWSVLEIIPETQEKNPFQKVFCKTLINNLRSKDSGIHVSLNWPTPSTPDYLTIVYQIEKIIQDTISNNGFKLPPNVIQLDSNYTIGHNNHGFIVSEWSNQFSYDSIRYLMWLCAYYMKKNLTIPQYLIEMISKIQISSQGVPTNGWYAKTCEPVNDQFENVPALIAPLAVAAKAAQADNYNQLISFLNKYHIISNKPASGKKSTPYFNAILYLLSEALLVYDGDFDPPILNVSIGMDSWNIGPVALKQSIKSSDIQLKNNGNINASIFMNASNGQSGWALANQPGNNAFSVNIYDPLMSNMITLKNEPQYFTNIFSETFKPFNIEYFSPIFDSIGAAQPQNYTIYFKIYPQIAETK